MKALGVRYRATISYSAEATIQAENPYKTWEGHTDGKRLAEFEMTDYEIKHYKM